MSVFEKPYPNRARKEAVPAVPAENHSLAVAARFWWQVSPTHSFRCDRALAFGSV